MLHVCGGIFLDQSSQSYHDISLSWSFKGPRLDHVVIRTLPCFGIGNCYCRSLRLNHLLTITLSNGTSPPFLFRGVMAASPSPRCLDRWLGTSLLVFHAPLYRERMRKERVSPRLSSDGASFCRELSVGGRRVTELPNSVGWPSPFFQNCRRPVPKSAFRSSTVSFKEREPLEQAR